MRPKVSIIIPVYKVEKYIRRCLNAVINQTLKEIEIIVVNDGSPDNCGRICDEYAAADRRVKVIHKNNAGVSSARNSGLSIATGEYIGFVDSDDYISETMFEDMYLQAILSCAEISMCHYALIDGSKDELSHKRSYAEGEIFKVSPKEAFELIADFGRPIQVTVWNKIYKRELIDGMTFDTNKRMAEDLEFLMKAVIKSKNIVYIPYALYAYYEQREGATTFHGNHNIQWYLEQNDNITYIMNEVAESSDEMRRLAIGYKCVNGDLSIANALVRSGNINKKVIEIVRRDLMKNVSAALSSELHILKKVQIVVFIISPCLYAKLMKKKLVD